ncbi:hypothetical protein LTR36_001231 [Oleoguttula mirabilis]|uniref:Uncharacterized protein n=1 Tax=Oleoguttula mirabilis TaxID=1507867 RepID=A0AAV9JPS6_9PEZI|nr:hypothetical protein LTR36_001231 [Oleoguttula mirabilis]
MTTNSPPPPPLLCCFDQLDYDGHFTAFLSFARTHSSGVPAGRQATLKPIGSFAYLFTLVRYAADGDTVEDPRGDAANPRYFFAHTSAPHPPPPPPPPPSPCRQEDSAANNGGPSFGGAFAAAAAAAVPPPDSFVEILWTDFVQRRAEDRRLLAERKYRCAGDHDGGGWYGVLLSEVVVEHVETQWIPPDWAKLGRERQLEMERLRMGAKDEGVGEGPGLEARDPEGAQGGGPLEGEGEGRSGLEDAGDGHGEEHVTEDCGRDGAFGTDGLEGMRRTRSGLWEEEEETTSR